jgi:hypothetical protein
MMRRFIRVVIVLLALVLLGQTALGVVLVTNFHRSVPPPSPGLVEAARQAGGWTAVELHTEDGLILRVSSSARPAGVPS